MDGSKQKQMSSRVRMRGWVEVGVIYAIRGTEYLTEGVLRTGGAHSGGLVVVIRDEGVDKTVKTETCRDPGSAWDRGTVRWAAVLDPRPTPRPDIAQNTGIVVHTVEPAVTITRRIRCALGRRDSILHAHVKGKTASAE